MHPEIPPMTEEPTAQDRVRLVRQLKELGFTSQVSKLIAVDSYHIGLYYVTTMHDMANLKKFLLAFYNDERTQIQ